MESALREGGREPGLKLIETLLWDGFGLSRVRLHLARLEKSAQRLGWSCDVEAARVALHNAVEYQHPARLRLTLDATGKLEVQAFGLPPPQAEWRVALAKTTISSGDPWLSVKSTRRGVYDAARAALPDAVDEVLFLNERGEVCEGTITNVFFDRGKGLRTPPLSCGLLPGVLRSDLACTKELLFPEHLPHVRLWVGNSLRGLIPAFYCSQISPPEAHSAGI